MHFQHPELLYALFLLVIPLIVHLFRLRRFQKEDFTNVKFLKKVIQETRKSSRLKKFLILITRLLLITCLVLAFAQPFIPASNKALTASRTLIYLDNSFSMQASKEQSGLLQTSVNQLLENLKEENEYGLFTNNENFFNRPTPELKNELQEIDFTDEQINFREIQLKAENYFKDYGQAEKELIIISDFQTSLGNPSEINQDNFKYHFIQRTPEKISNISIDSAYIEDSNPENISLSILVKANKEINEPATISIFNAEELLGRSSVQNFEDGQAKISFRLQNEKISNGRIEIEDSGLRYDNKLFFNISENKPVNTVIISNSDFEFLTRIYTEPEFETSNFSSDQIDYNQLNSANLIILNEVDEISSSLLNNLSNSQQNGASVIIIPPVKATNYGQLLNRLELPALGQKTETERLITGIVYDHPLLEGVFENRTDNFEYPKVLSSYNAISSNAILRYQDGQAFLIGADSEYLFTAPLNSTNSNFTNSPLIVPVLYQIGLNALKKNELYYETGKENKIDIPVELGKDEVMHITKPEFDIIPQQQNFSNRVEISTNNISLEAGNYEVSNTASVIGNISFNFDRSESRLTYTDISEINNLRVYDSVEEYFSETNAASQITALWKWFVIFALIFLAIEMLLIKFFK
ncbi:BatA domain-containing protein [Christiangramia sediminis]|uniref:BatA domain-containing protein n=1 Tax=Christiangramia sediminis TaxID=2881336 RepID=A0A9X1LGJ2_9FLAO|nr:BatA domain-containing protein [Christiangramia sediminis]MCB7479970.1 BatA domain-containing protein [Christiangramia sediminis]